MKTVLQCAFVAVMLFLLPNVNFGQAPNLGTTSGFALFTAAGAINNTGVSLITGDIGTNVGAFNGFPPGIIIGAIHVADPVSAQAAADVIIAYGDLAGRPCGMVLGTALGNNQTLTPNTYCLGAASVLNGDLILDGQGNPNAIFIFQIDGALATGVLSNVNLINGASLCNVFWQINGAVSFGENSNFRGTVIAAGALNFLQSATLMGRGLSTAGAINLNTNNVSVTLGLPPAVSIIVALGPTTFCEGGSVILTGNSGGIWNTGESTTSISVTTSGNYFVTNTNECGSVISNIITVAVNPLPICLITGDDFICAVGQSAELCAPTGYANYLWSTGATTSCITINTGGTYFVTVTGANGCSSNCSKTVTVNPMPMCMITGSDFICPGQTTELCTLPGNASYIWNTGEITNCITVNAPGTYSVTITSASGCISNCSKTVIISNSLPTITCPAGVAIECNQSTLPPNTGIATATDNCSPPPPTIGYDDTILGGACPQEYTITRVWTATNSSGNSISCVQTITVEDNTPPLITCPINATVQCTAQIPPVNTTLVVSSDNCGGVTIVTHVGDVITNQTCANRYDLTRAYRATDACGNFATCAQVITVFDNTTPSITCPANTTPVQCTNQVPVVNTALVVTSDNCGGTATVTHVGDVITNQTCANRFTLTRTYRATDACGNFATCAQVITVFDSTIPTVTCPVNATVQCTSQAPVNTALVVATDNCGGIATVNHAGDVITNQTCANRYTLTRTYQATDACGNIATCAQVITVFDSTPPTVTCTANATVQCASLVPAVNIALVAASDNCGGAAIVTHVGDVITNQTCANRYTLTRTYQATDACGNLATCAQVITVFDSTPPSVACPANATVQCASLVPAVNTGLVTTSDNCGGAAIVTHFGDAIANQVCANQFVLTRTYRATDVCGNVANCTQVITVFDNIPPTINFTNPLIVPGSTINVQCFGQDPNWNLPTFNEGSVTATDICAGIVAITFNEVLENAGNCGVDGYINRYRLTWTATDVCGNSSSTFLFLALIDTIPPVIFGVPADITVNCNEIPELPTLVYATDECLCACVVFSEQTEVAPYCQNGQVIVRTWTAMDECGNIGVETQNITLIDTIGPDWLILLPELAGITNDTILNYACNDGFPAYLDLLNEEFVLGENSCGASFVLSFEVDTIVSANCSLSGFLQQRNYHWTGVDACGNISSLTISARLVDTQLPVLIGVPVGAVCIGSPLLSLVQATDNCGLPSVQFKDVTIPNPCGTGKAVQRTYEAKDGCENIARDTVMLIPNDNNQPIIWFVNPDLAGMEVGEILTTDCASHSGLYTNFSADDVDVEDACAEGLSVIFTETLISTGDCATDGVVAIVELKWTATDICGNHSELVVTANIVDETSPVFVNFLPEVTIPCNAELPEVIITDNCGVVSSLTWDTIIYGDCVFEYDMQRIITATDQCGNTTTGIQTIHVGDGSGPVMSEIEEIVCDNVPMPIVTAYDSCAQSFVAVTMQVDTLDLPCGGLVIERTWTAVGICGDTAVSHQIIIINDTIPPVIKIPTYSVIQNFINAINGHVFSSDQDLIDQLNALDSSSVFIVDGCDQSIIAVFTVEISYADNCLEDGYFERRKYTWVATDVCGNSTTLSFSVDIMDDTPPVFGTYPSDITIVCEELPAIPVIIADNGAQSVTIVFTELIEPGVGIGVFIVTRTWTATDACGNVTVYVQHIKWIPDTFLECNIILPPVVDCNTHGVMINSTYTGGNGPVTYHWEIVGENCFIQGGQGTPKITIYMGWSDVKIILTVTDGFGCVSMCMTTLSCRFSLDTFTGLPPTTNTGMDDQIGSVSSNSSKQFSTGEYIKQLNLWPNPANGNLNLSFESSVENEVEFSFTNLLGQIVVSDKTFAKKGLNTLNIDMSQVREGSYLVQVKTEKEVHTKTVVIMHSN